MCINKGQQNKPQESITGIHDRNPFHGPAHSPKTVFAEETQDINNDRVFFSLQQVKKKQEGQLSQSNSGHFATCTGRMLPHLVILFQVLMYRRFTLSSDIWSMAVVLHEIWSLGRKPYFLWSAMKVSMRKPQASNSARAVWHPQLFCSYQLYVDNYNTVGNNTPVNVFFLI